MGASALAAPAGWFPRARAWAVAHPGASAAVAFLLFALPTLATPLCARDYYHLERVRDYRLLRFWDADIFEFKEFFWWPFDGYYCRFFRPLWSGFIALLYPLFGLHGVAYRLVWIALHLASILLFVRLVEAVPLSRRSRLTAGVLFALHPSWCGFALEPVAVGTANAMITAIVFGTVLAFLRWRDHGWAPGNAIACAGCLVALAAKEIGIILPAVIAALDVLVPSVSRPRPARPLAVLWRPDHLARGALAVGYLVFYLTVAAKPNHLRPPYYLTWSTPGYGVRMLHQVGVYFAHAITIGPLHPLADVELFMRHSGWLALYVALAGGLYFLLLRRSWRVPWARFTLALLALSLLPVLPVIVQPQEFAVPSAALAILLALAFDRAAPAWRRVVEPAIVIASGALLCFGLVACAAMANESAASLAAVRRELLGVRPDTRLYFINSNQWTWLGFAPALRLMFDQPTLSVQLLSFDCGELPPAPRTLLAGAFTRAIDTTFDGQVASCRPTLMQRSARGFDLVSDGPAFFDSDLGRFVLQGREPFALGEVDRGPDFVGRVGALRGDGATAFSFVFDGPLRDPRRVFLRWDGAALTRVRFADAFNGE